MRKTLFILAFILSSFLGQSQDNEWMVQIAVYDKQVPSNHFDGITDRLYYSKDAYNFNRYYVGKFDEAGANAKSKELGSMGYNTSTVHISSFDERCTCYKTPRPRELSPSLRSIFFDFDKYSLRAESRKQLNLMVKSLRSNSSFTGLLRAHTDSKGSNAYNERLSLNRANAAKNYLVARGISASRIKIATFGEDSPIAKNELDNGQDTEEGRQLNRRVELQILNSRGESMNIVEDIAVPTSLDIR